MNEIDFLTAKSVAHLSSLVTQRIFNGDETAWAGDVSDCAFDLNHTYQLLEYLRAERGIQLRITPIGYNGSWQVDRIDPAAVEKPVVAHGSTIAIAVCLAALRACGYSAVLEK